MKNKEILSKSNSLKVYINWAVLHMMSLDTLNVTWLHLPASWLQTCERFDIDQAVKHVAC